jgi:DNA-binding transcriptional regulator YiaG
MMITGRVWKDGTMWIAESEIADVCTQGKSRKDASAMLADAFETLIDRPSCKITVKEYGDDDSVSIEASEPATLAAFMLQRLRERGGLSLSQVAETMGRTSKNAYARYEQGEAVPTIEKFDELLRAVSADTTLIIGPRTARKPAVAKRPGPASSRRARR